jgi:hypothetical protein
MRCQAKLRALVSVSGQVVAQAVEEQVEQPAGLVALLGCPGDEGYPAEARLPPGSCRVAS